MIADKIREEILSRTESKNLNIALLEKKAGLPTNAIRNIIAGGSKNPGIKSLSAIAKVLECSVNDLLGQKDSKKTEKSIQLERIHQQALEQNELVLELFNQISDFIETYINQYKFQCTFEEFLSLIREAYIFALRKNAKKINTSFIEWLVENKNNPL